MKCACKHINSLNVAYNCLYPLEVEQNFFFSNILIWFSRSKSCTYSITSTLWKLYTILKRIITYIYNALNDALSTYRIHDNLQTLFSKYIHVQSIHSCNHSHTHTHTHTEENSLRWEKWLLKLARTEILWKKRRVFSFI